MTPSSGSINLQQPLKEFRETIDLPDDQCISKGYNAETARWKRWRGQGMGKRGWLGAKTLKTSQNCPTSPRLPPPDFLQ